MKTKFTLSILLITYLISNKVSAQNVNFGISFGIPYYIGELNPSTPVLNKVNPSIGVFYRKNFNKRYALKTGINYIKLGASDSFSSNDFSRFRNLSFSSNAIEGFSTLEFNFIPYQINNQATSSFTPYVFIGAAILFKINLNLETNDNTIETPSSVGSSTHAAIPFGMGMKFNFVNNLGVSIEWGLRRTFTDRLDGLPDTFNNIQIGDSQNKDWYSLIGITLNYKILTQSDRCPGAIN